MCHAAVTDSDGRELNAQCQVSGDAWRDVHNVCAFYHMSIAKLRLKSARSAVYRVPSRPRARA
jgi:hypothetical protein